MSNEKQLAIATTLGISPTTLARLEQAGIDQETEQRRFNEIAIFAGRSADELLLFVESGVTIQTLEVAAQVQRDSATAERSSFESIVDLTHMIGDLGGHRKLPEGLTIFHGKVVTAQQAAQIELEELERAASGAGLTTDSTEIAKQALPGTAGASDQSDGSAVAEAKPLKAKEPENQALNYEPQSAQETILSVLLEIADEADVSVTTLGAFIRNEYDGQALKAFVAFNHDEADFKDRLGQFAVGPVKDLLLDEDDIFDHRTRADNVVEESEEEESEEEEGQPREISMDDLAEKEE